MRKPSVTLPSIATVLLAGLLLADDGGAQQGSAAQVIFLNAVEMKGSTTADKLPPPPVNPKDLSKGYEFKGLGVADKNAPKKWEVSSYAFTPGFVAVRQGDTVVLNAFVVNGDEHEVRVTAPDGATVVPKTKWNRGREYRVEFVAQKAGSYQLVCSTHAPTMLATVLVLPR